MYNKFKDNPNLNNAKDKFDISMFDQPDILKLTGTLKKSLD